MQPIAMCEIPRARSLTTNETCTHTHKNRTQLFFSSLTYYVSGVFPFEAIFFYVAFFILPLSSLVMVSLLVRKDSLNPMSRRRTGAVANRVGNELAGGDDVDGRGGTTVTTHTHKRLGRNRRRRAWERDGVPRVLGRDDPKVLFFNVLVRVYLSCAVIHDDLPSPDTYCCRE